MIQFRIVGLALAVVLVHLGGCFSAKGTRADSRELIGTVQVVGNEPYTRLALDVKGTGMIILKCSGDIETFVRSHQGQTMKVLGRDGGTSPEGPVVEVLEANLLSPSN